MEILGELDLEKVFKLTTEERLMRYFIKSYENLIKVIFPACCIASNKYIQQCFTILDLKLLTSKLLESKVFLISFILNLFRQ